jgi:DNA-binding NarL/FixJ family response regulator
MSKFQDMARSIPVAVIIDSRPLFRDSVKLFMMSTFDMTAMGVENEHEAFVLAQNHRVDVFMFDAAHHGSRLMDTIRRYKREFPKIPVFVYNSSKEDYLALRLLRAGADGYIPSSTKPEELTEAVKSLMQGRKYIGTSIAGQIFTNTSKIKEGRLAHELLSDREYQIFRMIATGLSVSEISVELFLSVKTVSTYRKRVLEKMSLKSNADIVQYAVKNNLV